MISGRYASDTKTGSSLVGVILLSHEVTILQSVNSVIPLIHFQMEPKRREECMQNYDKHVASDILESP